MVRIKKIKRDIVTIIQKDVFQENILRLDYNGMIADIRTTIFVVLLFQTLSINQNCPCLNYNNSYCLNNGMCACNSGYIGNCSTPAQTLNTSTLETTLVQGGTPYFVVSPISLDSYIEFTVNICVQNVSADLTFYLWGETGNQNTYNDSNVLGNPVSGTVEGCQQLLSPYISFGTQPNGLNDQLVIGILNSSPTVIVTLSISQQLVIGVYLYYYILFALIALVGLSIIIGIGVFVMRQRRRRRRGLGRTSENQYNEIEHFQNYMPIFKAERLGEQRSICPICLQQIQAAEVVRQPPCGHVYHSTCIDSWALKNLSCPVCRADLSATALQTVRRISVVRVSLPPEQDWQQQPENPVDSRTVDAQKDKSPPPPPLLDDKYQIKENML